MSFTEPTPIFVQTSDVPSATAFDISTASWQLPAFNIEAEPVQLVGDTTTRWVEADEHPAEEYLAKQAPALFQVHHLMNGWPIYQVLPKYISPRVGDVHTFGVSSTYGENTLPYSSFYYLNDADAATNGWALFNSKCVSMSIAGEWNTELFVASGFYGCQPWVYGNATDATGLITVSGSLQSNPEVLGSCNGYCVDGRTEITYDGAAWNNALYSFEYTVARPAAHVHQDGNSIQEERWPSSIMEYPRIPSAYVDLKFYQGQTNTLWKDIYAGTSGRFGIKCYATDPTDNKYVSLTGQLGEDTYLSNGVSSVNTYREIGGYFSVRVKILQPEIIIKDGLSANWSDQ
jgi:hypothetical protein